MVKRGASVTSTLFVLPRNPAAEVWSGRRLGTEGAAGATGLATRERRALEPALDSLLSGAAVLHVVGELGGVPPERLTTALLATGRLTPDAQVVLALRQRHPSLRIASATGIVRQLRGTKSAAEMALIRQAVEITVAAHREAMALVEPGMNEFEAQALIEYTFRRNGADRPAFASIVGSGPNSTILHYNRDDRFMRAGETVVIDVGASYHGYAADVTRTLPVSGSFSPAQREIYALVRSAQAAAEREARPGAPHAAMTMAASATLAAGLARLGLIESPDATYDCDAGGDAQCPQLGLFYMHGLGHGIGLEVHDPDAAELSGVLGVGSAFTIEPGVYVRENVLEILPDTPRNRRLVAALRPAVERYRNIGVRIEDDYLITDRGLEWISRAPRELDEVEAAMRTPFAAPARRDSARVNAYGPRN
jgi:Xaa-Pro aminopeptidase